MNKKSLRMDVTYLGRHKHNNKRTAAPTTNQNTTSMSVIKLREAFNIHCSFFLIDGSAINSANLLIADHHTGLA